MTLAALFVSSLAMAQMPYNPDSNGDNLVGSGDLLTFLTFYGNELIQSNLTCDYEGTELEQLIVGAITGALQIDSIYIEYLLLDTLEYFTPGCPDPVFEPVALERSYFVYPWYFNDDTNVAWQNNYLNYWRRFYLSYDDSDNDFSIAIEDYEVSATTSYSSYGSYVISESGTGGTTLPFPATWFLDEDGMQLPWSTSRWAGNCENFRLIPFWSVAE